MGFVGGIVVGFVVAAVARAYFLKRNEARPLKPVTKSVPAGSDQQGKDRYFVGLPSVSSEIDDAIRPYHEPHQEALAGAKNDVGRMASTLPKN